MRPNLVASPTLQPVDTGLIARDTQIHESYAIADYEGRRQRGHDLAWSNCLKVSWLGNCLDV